jgi:CelD/BcsL family acetyltransferase involved in cellulose biosynthesis
MPSLRTIVAQSPSEMDALAPLWDRLLCRQSHSLFQRFSWNRLAALTFSDRLSPYVVCAQSDAGAAIIPAAFNHKEHRFELLGEVLFDYRDVLHAGDPDVLRVAWRHLAEHKKQLHIVSVDSVTEQQRWIFFAPAPFAMAPEVKDIPEETFRLAHSRLGRQLRRLEKRGVALRICPGNDSHVVRHLYECKRTHLATDGAANVFLDSRRSEFMVAAAALEGNACEIYTLEKDASLVAGLLTFRDEHVRRFYTIYFHPAWARYSPGQVLLFEATARSLADGLRCDYMTGEYPYKLRLANASRQLFRVDVSAEQLADIANRTPFASAA